MPRTIEPNQDIIDEAKEGREIQLKEKRLEVCKRILAQLEKVETYQKILDKELRRMSKASEYDLANFSMPNTY